MFSRFYRKKKNQWYDILKSSKESIDFQTFGTTKRFFYWMMAKSVRKIDETSDKEEACSNTRLTWEEVKDRTHEQTKQSNADETSRG